MMAEFHLKFHHSVQKYFFSKHQNEVILAISLLISSGFENLSGLYDLNKLDNITGLNDLNSLFGLKNQKLLAL
jgi:hypothetical protein